DALPYPKGWNLIFCALLLLQVCRFRRFVLLHLREIFFLENGTRVALQALWGVVGFQKFRLLGDSNLRNLQTCDFPVHRSTAAVFAAAFNVQTALVELAADRCSQRLAEPALEVAFTQIVQLVGQCTVEVSCPGAFASLRARLE